jgi:hypothetical protein
MSSPGNLAVLIWSVFVFAMAKPTYICTYLPTSIHTDGVSIQMGPSFLNITFAAAQDLTLTLSAASPSPNGNFSSGRPKGDAFLFLVVAVRRRDLEESGSAGSKCGP